MDAMRRAPGTGPAIILHSFARRRSPHGGHRRVGEGRERRSSIEPRSVSITKGLGTQHLKRGDGQGQGEHNGPAS